MTIRLIIGVFVLVAMLIGVAPAAYAQSNPVREAQQHLGELGYAPGPADGQIGPTTREAVRAFQRDNELPVTGVLDDLTLRVIRDSVINQTLFGGTVALEIERPEPEIVPLNPDGSVAGVADEAPATSPSTPAAGTDITAAIPVPELLADTDRPSSATDNADSVAPLPVVEQPVPAERPTELPNRLTAAPVELPLPGDIAPGNAAGQGDAADMATTLDALPQLDLDIDPAPPIVASEPAESVSEGVPDAAPMSRWFSGTSIFDRVVSLARDYVHWLIVPAVLLLAIAAWRTVRRLLGSGEPKRVAITRAEYMASAGTEPFKPGGHDGEVDGMIPTGQTGRPGPQRVPVPKRRDDETGGPRTGVVEPVTLRGTDRTGPVEYGPADLPNRPRPVPVHRPQLHGMSEQRRNTEADTRRRVLQPTTAAASPRHDPRRVEVPRIIRSANVPAEGADEMKRAAAQQPGIRSIGAERTGVGDPVDLRMRRLREPGASPTDGRISRPPRPRREGT